MPDRLDQLRNRIQHSPSDPQCLHELGQEYSRMGLDDRAMAHFELALEIEPDFLPSALGKAGCQARARDRTGAIETLGNAAEVATELGDADTLEEIRAMMETIEQQ